MAEKGDARNKKGAENSEGRNNDAVNKKKILETRDAE